MYLSMLYRLCTLTSRLIMELGPSTWRHTDVPEYVVSFIHTNKQIDHGTWFKHMTSYMIHMYLSMLYRLYTLINRLIMELGSSTWRHTDVPEYVVSFIHTNKQIDHGTWFKHMTSYMIQMYLSMLYRLYTLTNRLLMELCSSTWRHTDVPEYVVLFIHTHKQIDHGTLFRHMTSYRCIWVCCIVYTHSQTDWSWNFVQTHDLIQMYLSMLYRLYTLTSRLIMELCPNTWPHTDVPEYVVSFIHTHKQIDPSQKLYFQKEWFRKQCCNLVACYSLVQILQ